MTIANLARGEVLAHLAGEGRKLCLTLGALAEIESAFGTDSWQGLIERMHKLSPSDLLVVLGALLKGGGEHEIAARLAHLPVNLPEAAQAVAAAFTAAAGPDAAKA